jgi:signal transduction histidine kinase
MGVGLAICKTIVEAHDGKISAKNNSNGIGSTFEFTLPIYPYPELDKS